MCVRNKIDRNFMQKSSNNLMFAYQDILFTFFVTSEELGNFLEQIFWDLPIYYKVLINFQQSGSATFHTSKQNEPHNHNHHQQQQQQISFVMF